MTRLWRWLVGMWRHGWRWSEEHSDLSLVEKLRRYPKERYTELLDTDDDR